MKYILYLSAIIVFLSSCKGNAFMKQRYTHFSSVKHKHEQKAPSVKNAVQHEQVAVQDSKEDASVGSLQVPAEQLVSSNEVKAENVVFHSAPVTHQKSVTENRGIEKYTSQVGQHFKKISQKEERRGVIGLILEIILSIIILAIIVSVVILVVLV